MLRFMVGLILLGLISQANAADSTIDALGAGSALTGAESVPMFQSANPAVKTTTRAIGNLAPGNGTAYIDATQQSGADMCAKIAAAQTALISASPFGGVVDARGFLGVQPCAGSMFLATGNVAVTILLGATSIQTAVPQNPPTLTALVGSMPFSINAPLIAQATGTVIQPANSNSFVVTKTTSGSTASGAVLPFTDTSGIVVGDSVTGTNIVVHTTVQSIVTNTSVTVGEAISGTVGSGATITFTHPIMSMGAGAVSTAVQISNLKVSCQQPNASYLSGGIGIQNDWAQQQSFLFNVVISGCFTNFDIETTNAQNGGPYNYVTMAAGYASVNETCMKIGNNNGSNTVLESAFHGLSCGGAGVGFEPTVGIYQDAYSLGIYDSNVENVVTGIEVGRYNFVHGLLLSNINCGGQAQAMTTCVDISSNNSVDAATLTNITGYSGDGVTNRLVDHINSRTITTPWVAYYILAHDGSIIADGATNLFTTLGTTAGVTCASGVTAATVTVLKGIVTHC